jgi:hypothetical protein
LGTLATTGPAAANPVGYTGQGIDCTSGTCLLKTEICGVENGAEVDGPYILWVFTAAGPNVQSATISLSGCGSDTGGAMEQKGQGAFHYVSEWCDLDAVHAQASYEGTAQGIPQLVISHGCPPVVDAAIWCSPGYWRNALDAAWELTPYSRDDKYKETACATTPFKTRPSAPSDKDPTLQKVLNNPDSYGGPAFNCVGQLLTNDLCGGGLLNPDCPDGPDCEDNCPYDHHGNVKDDAPAVCQP